MFHHVLDFFSTQAGLREVSELPVQAGDDLAMLQTCSCDRNLCLCLRSQIYKALQYSPPLQWLHLLSIWSNHSSSVWSETIWTDCDGGPSLRLSMRSDCHTTNPGLWLFCGQVASLAQFSTPERWLRLFLPFATLISSVSIVNRITSASPKVFQLLKMVSIETEWNLIINSIMMFLGINVRAEAHFWELFVKKNKKIAVLNAVPLRPTNSLGPGQTIPPSPAEP